VGVVWEGGYIHTAYVGEETVVKIFTQFHYSNLQQRVLAGNDRTVLRFPLGPV
jgi:hypothetical protein